MNKLEELKAATKEFNTARLELVRSQIAQDEEEVVASFYADYRKAATNLDFLRCELIPHLIAVAEAAKKIDWPNVCVKNYEERNLVNVLQDALLPLTKDTDK